MVFTRTVSFDLCNKSVLCSRTCLSGSYSVNQFVRKRLDSPKDFIKLTGLVWLLKLCSNYGCARAVSFMICIQSFKIYIQSYLIVFSLIYIHFEYHLYSVSSCLYSVSSYLFIFRFVLFVFNLYLFMFRGFTRIVQPWFHQYLIWALTSYSAKLHLPILFHFCITTSIDHLMRLLKITRYQECYLFFKLIKYVFLLIALFN